MFELLPLHLRLTPRHESIILYTMTSAFFYTPAPCINLSARCLLTRSIPLEATLACVCSKLLPNHLSPPAPPFHLHPLTPTLNFTVHTLFTSSTDRRNHCRAKPNRPADLPPNIRRRESSPSSFTS